MASKVIQGTAATLMRKVYLAGPDVFLPDAVAIGARKKELCAKYGFEGLYPFDNEIPSNLHGERIDRLIYRANERMIRAADLGICNLTPFRGASADSGTVFELGMLIGFGKRVFGYSNITSDYLDRVRALKSGVSNSVENVWRDSNGMMIENFANADNLMIDNSLIEHGGWPIVRHEANPSDLFYDLTAFETCLRHAREATSKTVEAEKAGLRRRATGG